MKVYSYVYSVSLDDLPTARLRVLLPAASPAWQSIEYMELFFPATITEAETVSIQWDNLEHILLDIHEAARPPHLQITCTRREQATDILALLFLSDTIFPRLRDLGKVSVEIRDSEVPLWLDISGEGIFSPQATATFDDLTVTLSDAQRAE